MPNNLLPLIAFLSEISRINKNQPHKKFCFILGAGASKSSGIPLAEELVDRWLKQIKIRNPRYKDLDYNNFIIQWGNDLKQPIEINFNNRAEFYSNIYYELYKDNKSLGQAEITNLTEKGHPSIGYLFLAEILKNTHHNTVITTNFDNLIIKALGYSSIYPLVCHLPEMPKYINNYHNGPKINKIHGDVFFQQQHNLNSSLDPIWKNIIDNIFQTHILIIAGYSGNDNTLFSALKTSPHLNNKNNNGSHIYWMHYKGTNKEPSEPSAKIKTLLSEQKGKYVPICGFDELMLLIHNVLSSKEHDPHDFSTYLMDEANKFIDELNHKNNEFISKIQTQIPKLKKNIAKLDDTIFENIGKLDDDTFKHHWGYWENKARHEADFIKRKGIYLEGLKVLPDSHQLHGNYAVFCKTLLKDNNLAELHYVKALEIDPNDAFNLGNYAFFLATVKSDLDKALEKLKLSIEIKPDMIENRTRLAYILLIKERYQEADTEINAAWSLDFNKNSATAALLLLFQCITNIVLKRENKFSLDKLNNLINDNFIPEKARYDGIKSEIIPNIKRKQNISKQICDLYEKIYDRIVDSDDSDQI